MSSGFVSGGTIDGIIQRDDEWLKAQKEIEESRRRKEEEGKQEGGKTLFEVLQHNKVAKQEAFEESIRLKNQFRNLDEDEIEFLDSVLESTRAKEEAVKKETIEQLDIFRRQQEEADKAIMSEAVGVGDTSPIGGIPPGESQWAINARKRKRAKGREALLGAKVRKTSLANEYSPLTAATENDEAEGEAEGASDFVQKEDETVANNKDIFKAVSPTITSDDGGIKFPATEQPSAVGLGLIDYSSDED